MFELLLSRGVELIVSGISAYGSGALGSFTSSPGTMYGPASVEFYYT